MIREFTGRDTIKVRLEIDFPEGVSAPVTITIGDHSTTASSRSLGAIDSDGIGPMPPDPALVKVAGSGTSGSICASGSDPASASAGICTEVYLLVQQPNTPISSSPPPGAVMTIPETDGSWEYNGVPGASCAWLGTGVLLPENQLVVWKRWSNLPDYAISARSFHGQCSPRTNCDPIAEVARRSVGAMAVAVPSREIVDTVPAAWDVKVQGFEGEGVTPFNGSWNLIQFRHTAPGHLAWVTNGDSVLSPRVELFGQACGCTPFELRFSSRGCTISYRFHRENWNPVGINFSDTVMTSGLPAGAEFPGRVEVVPNESGE